MNEVKAARPSKRLAGCAGDEARKRRRCNRTTILTTTRRAFDRARRLEDGQSLVVECPNDIISSARQGRDNVHHSIRRVELVRRSFRGGHLAVFVRCEQGDEVRCVLCGAPVGERDATAFRVRVCRALPSAGAAAGDGGGKRGKGGKSTSKKTEMAR